MNAKWWKMIPFCGRVLYHWFLPCFFPTATNLLPPSPCSCRAPLPAAGVSSAAHRPAISRASSRYAPGGSEWWDKTNSWGLWNQEIHRFCKCGFLIAQVSVSGIGADRSDCSALWHSNDIQLAFLNSNYTCIYYIIHMNSKKSLTHTATM